MNRFLLLAFLASLGACSQVEDSGPVDRGGTGGAGGTGGTAGHGDVARDCGASYDPLRWIFVSTARRPNANAIMNSYAGPAIVETSAADGFELAFEEEAAGGAKVTARAMISSSLPLPLLPLGARVWFALNPIVEGFLFGPWTQTMSIRDREGGTLLLGFAKDSPAPFDEPVSARGVTAVCTEIAPETCFPDRTLTHQEVEIAGDATVKIADGHMGIVAIGGVDYDVTVNARSYSAAAPTQCADAYLPHGLNVAVMAHDPAPIIAGLEIDTGPRTCAVTAPVRTCDPSCPAGQYCWDLYDHDTYCGGTACTAACCTDADCVAFYASDPNASNARCGADHLCDPTGFGGAFFCAAR
jgi:hypothetical protein